MLQSKQSCGQSLFTDSSLSFKIMIWCLNYVIKKSLNLTIFTVWFRGLLQNQHYWPIIWPLSKWEKSGLSWKCPIIEKKSMQSHQHNFEGKTKRKKQKRKKNNSVQLRISLKSKNHLKNRSDNQRIRLVLTWHTPYSQYTFDLQGFDMPCF